MVGNPLHNGFLILLWILFTIMGVFSFYLSLNVVSYIIWGTGFPIGNIVVPFSWMETGFIFLFGKLWGEILGKATLLFVASIPLTMGLTFFVHIFVQTLQRYRLILTGQCKDKEIIDLATTVAKDNAVKPPLVVVNPAATSVITYRSSLLGKNIIEIPLLFEKLSKEEQKSILAHEIGHILNDGKMVALLQRLSDLSIFGRGLLTVALDYQVRELSADEFAIRYTGNPEVMANAIKKLSALSLAESLRKKTKQRKIFLRLREIYDFHYGYALLGYVHPTIEERIKHTQSHKTTQASLVG